MSRPTYEELERRIQELETQAGEGKRLQEEERCEKEKAQEYLDIAGVAIVAINDRGEVTLINRKGCEILGYPEEEVVGRSWFDHFLPERVREKVRRLFFSLISGEGEPVKNYQNPVLTRSGEERIIEWYNALIRDESGNPTGTISSGEDVTERVKAEEALRQAHEELARFSMDLEKIVEQRTEELKEKSKQLVEAERMAALGRIANRIAHDFRNPLTVIGGFARRLFEKTPEGDPNRKYLKIILQEATNLEARISEIIKMGREEYS